MEFDPWQLHYKKTTHNTHITENSVTKTTKPVHKHQGHITANEYNLEERKKVKLYLLQTLEAY
jgi:hypothetical protein